jgi:hypothetical protein
VPIDDDLAVEFGGAARARATAGNAQGARRPHGVDDQITTSAKRSSAAIKTEKPCAQSGAATMLAPRGFIDLQQTGSRKMEIEGTTGKRFRVYYCNVNNEPHECEAEYDTPEELNAHRWRHDRRYKIRAGGKFFGQFFEWIKTQPKK